MTIIFDSDDEISERNACQASHDEEQDVIEGVAIWLEKVTRKWPRIDSAAAAGIARLQARKLEAAGDKLGAIAFVMRAQDHTYRAELFGQTTNTLADVQKSEAAA